MICNKSAVVARIVHAVPIRIADVFNQRTAVSAVGNAVAINIWIAGIANAVTVSVLLIRISDSWAIIRDAYLSIRNNVEDIVMVRISIRRCGSCCLGSWLGTVVSKRLAGIAHTVKIEVRL